MARREYKGAAVQTRLSSNINAAATSFSINNAAGWPTGGANGSFIVTLDPGLATEERILVGSRSGTTLNSVTRGIDDTSAVDHAAGSDGTVIHSDSAMDNNEANRHINDTTIDEHTQYMRTDGTRHDLTARHSAGSVVPTAAPVAIGTGLAEGAGTSLARSTHVHVVGTGAIDNANMFAAGVVDAAAIGADQVGTSEIAPVSVTSAELANDSVINTKIADTAIDDENMFSASLTPWIYSNSNPGAVGAGRVWFRPSNECLFQRNAGDTGWNLLATYGQSISYTPTLTGMTIGAGGSPGPFNLARYHVFGRRVIADGFISFGTSASFTGNYTIGLPLTAADFSSFASFEYMNHGAARGSDTSSGVAFAAVGVVLMGASSPTLNSIGFFATAGYAAWNPTTPFTWAAGDRLSWFLEYERANSDAPAALVA